MVKFTPLSDKLAALTPPQPGENTLARPQGRQGQSPSGGEPDSGSAAGKSTRDEAVSSPGELEQAQDDVRAALKKFGREAPTRTAEAESLQRPGSVLDIRI